MLTIKTDAGPKIPRWKIGLYIWRKNNEWRLRLFRPWRRTRMIEVQSADFLTTLYCLGIGAGWWKEL